MRTRGKGFSLLEILVTLFLVSFVTLAVLTSGGGFSTGSALDRLADDVERSVRFAEDEAVLRNRVVRLRFLLDREPQEYAVEYGPDAGFVLPGRLVGGSGDPGAREREEAERLDRELARRFTRVDELSEGNKRVEEGARVVGVGSLTGRVFVSEGEASVHVYPDGERDAAFVALAGEGGLALVTTEAFLPDVGVDRRGLPDGGGGGGGGDGGRGLEERRLALARELFTEWVEGK